MAMELGSGGVTRRGLVTVLDPEAAVCEPEGFPPFALPGDVWLPFTGFAPLAAAFCQTGTASHGEKL